MPRPKSVIKTILIDKAKKSHNCQHNKGHRISKGERRLKIKNDRSFNCFCCECGRKIIEDDIKKLEEYYKELID